MSPYFLPTQLGHSKICPKIQSNVLSPTNIVSFCTTFFLDYFKGIYNKINNTLLFWIFTTMNDYMLNLYYVWVYDIGFFPLNPLGSFFLEAF